MFYILLQLLLAASIPLAYLFFRHRFTYWRRRNVPTLPPSIPFGNIGNPLTRKRAFYESVAAVYDAFKPTGAAYGGFYTLTLPHLVPIDNTLIKRMLMSDFGAFVNRGLYYDERADPLSANLFFIGGTKWRVMRQKLTATFTGGKMQSMFGILVECSANLVAKLQSSPEADVRETLACYATEVIGSCAFGVECGSLQDDGSDFRRYTRKLFEYSPAKTLKRMVQMLWPEVCSALRVRFIPADVSDFFMRAVEETVDMRRRNGVKRNDFLDLLCELEDAGVLDKSDFAAQSFVFFVAGFETSSTTLVYLLYELSKRPEMQERLRQEISDTLGKDGVMTYEKVMGMKYLDQLVEETLRMYPVLPFLFRECTDTFKVDDSLTLEPGEKVVIPTLAIHMDADYFPDPEMFDPERFSTENRGSIKPGTYMPFGEGPRKCIGMRFGQMQVKVGAVAIVRNFLIGKHRRTMERLKWDTNGFTLKTKDGIYLDFAKIDLPSN